VKKPKIVNHYGDTLSENLRMLRKNKGWSRDELARRAGISGITIVNLEEDGGARVDTVQKIAKALGVVTSELLGEVRTPLTPRETQMVVIYRKLNVKMRRAFMYVGMAMAGEVEEDEEPMRKSADWDRPTVNRDPVKEMNDRAAARGEKRPDLDRLAELGVELGREPRPDAKSLYPGPEVHARIEPLMNEVLGDA